MPLFSLGQALLIRGPRRYGTHVASLFSQHVDKCFWTTLIPAKVSKVTSWETPVVGPSHFGSFPLTLLDDLPYARPIKSPWFPVSSTRPKCWTCSADVGLQTSPGISIDVTYRFCFPISANNKHSLLQSIPIHFPTILCELIHTLTLTNNNRIV